MKKNIILVLLLVLGGLLHAQETNVRIHWNNSIRYEQQISNIDSIKLQDGTAIFNDAYKKVAIPFSQLDSLTFITQEEEEDDTTQIIIKYIEDSVKIINPMASKGVAITADGAHVAIDATGSDVKDLVYHLKGKTKNGSLTMNSGKRFTFNLEGVDIYNPAGAAIAVSSDKKVTIHTLSGTVNSFSDCKEGSQKGALHSKGQLVFEGEGELIIFGNTRFGISCSDAVTMTAGFLYIEEAVSDGIHCEGFTLDGGEVHIQSNSDGVDAGEGEIAINRGLLKVVSTAEDMKALKCDGNLTIVDGNVEISVGGNQSKGMKAGGLTSIQGGEINITAAGSTVLEAEGKGNEPSYCSGIKGDSSIVITGGTINIQLPKTNKGGRGISSDYDISIKDAYITINTAGDGATYTNSEGKTDAYSSCCIKSNTNIAILSGKINCTSSGTAGKGISADGTLTFGESGAKDDKLQLDVTTSGTRFYVTSEWNEGGHGGPGGGGPGGGGPGQDNNTDYANPKAIKCDGNLTCNSGTITVNCTQTTEGGECMESNDTLTLNGGWINLNSKYDDAINAGNHIQINGGTTYCYSGNNDAIDCNGTLTIAGGFTIANGSKEPEGGFDCDQNRFSITGGTLIGTGGSSSTPTASACTQRSILYTGSANQMVYIKNEKGEVILAYQKPALSGSNNMLMLFSSPELVKGNYTLYYGGTITGSDNFHGYFISPSCSGGTAKTFSTNNMVTTIR